MAYIANRLDRADLIVGMHHTDKYRPRRNRPPHVAGVDTAKAIDGQDTYGETLPLQETARSDDCWMLNRGGDDVVALSLQRPGHPLDRKVICLAAATGEDDLIVRGAEQRCYVAARLFERGLGARSRPMPAR